MRIKIIPIFLPENQCPFKCKFCNVKVANGEEGITNVEDIEEILNNALETINRYYPDYFVEAAFFGGTFTFGKREDMENYLKSIKPYIDSGKINGIRVSTRPDFFDNDIAEMFKDYKVTTVEFGVQSFNNEVLKACRRGHDGDTAERAVKLSVSYGFKTSVHLMTGLPFQTEQVFLDDIKKTIELKPHYVRIHPLAVLKGTEFANEGYVAPDCGEIMDYLTKGVFLLKSNGIEVIKLGLQPTDSLNTQGSVLSGCYHQSLKHEVYSRIFRKFLENLIEKKVKNLTVSPADFSYFTGFKGLNRDLIEKIDLKSDNKVERETVIADGEKVSIFKESLYD